MHWRGAVIIGKLLSSSKLLGCSKGLVLRLAVLLTFCMVGLHQDPSFQQMLSLLSGAVIYNIAQLLIFIRSLYTPSSCEGDTTGSPTGLECPVGRP